MTKRATHRAPEPAAESGASVMSRGKDLRIPNTNAGAVGEGSDERRCEAEAGDQEAESRIVKRAGRIAAVLAFILSAPVTGDECGAYRRAIDQLDNMQALAMELKGSTSSAIDDLWVVVFEATMAASGTVEDSALAAGLKDIDVHAANKATAKFEKDLEHYSSERVDASVPSKFRAFAIAQTALVFHESRYTIFCTSP